VVWNTGSDIPVLYVHELPDVFQDGVHHAGRECNSVDGSSNFGFGITPDIATHWLENELMKVAAQV
jgi:hypothetical protein